MCTNYKLYAFTVLPKNTDATVFNQYSNHHKMVYGPLFFTYCSLKCLLFCICSEVGIKGRMTHQFWDGTYPSIPDYDNWDWGNGEEAPPPPPRPVNAASPVAHPSVNFPLAHGEKLVQCPYNGNHMVL